MSLAEELFVEFECLRLVEELFVEFECLRFNGFPTRPIDAFQINGTRGQELMRVYTRPSGLLLHELHSTNTYP